MTKVIKVTFQIEVDGIFPDAYFENGVAQDLTIEELVNKANEDKWSDDEDKKALNFLIKKACRLDDGLDHAVTKDLLETFDEVTSV